MKYCLLNILRFMLIFSEPKDGCDPNAAGLHSEAL